MKTSNKQVGWLFWLQWSLASIMGMFVGFFMGFIIAGLTHGVLGGRFAHAILGIVLGIGIGAMQWLVLRRRLSRTGWWILATVAVGYTIVHAGFMGFSASVNSLNALLRWTGIVAFGGAVTGVLQWLVLRPQISRSGWWVLISTVSWGLSVTVARAFSWGVDDADAFGALIVTGAILGTVTGAALIWLLRQSSPDAEPK
jgi:hypothetical protein